MPQAAKSGGSAAPETTDEQTAERKPRGETEAPHLRYVGDDTRVYPAVPITVQPGDVVAIPDPGDGRFEATSDAVTRWPDNDPRSAPTPEQQPDSEGE